MEFKCFTDKAETYGILSLNRDVNSWIKEKLLDDYKFDSKEVSTITSGDNSLIAPVIVVTV